MANIFIYVVARDFGFAPNPFNGVCTLATCKPRIRSTAKAGDWVVGMGGGQLNATGRCIYFMKVTGAVSFNEYWQSPQFRCKRPVRNGSRKAMVGDNIYHRDHEYDKWTQEDSHHSKEDGSPEWWNVETDTSADRVLYSNEFVYFGKSAPPVPEEILNEIGYSNVRNHRTFKSWNCRLLTEWLEGQMSLYRNEVLDDPFQFTKSASRYSRERNKIVS